MNNPRSIQCSSETEYRAMLIFQDAIQRMLLAGGLDDEWMVGVFRARDGAMQQKVEFRRRHKLPPEVLS